MKIYLFYFQFIYPWQILFHRTIRLAFHKQQGLSQTSGAINNIVECCYRWHQIFETEPQSVVLIKVNTNQNRNANIRQYAPNWQMILFHPNCLFQFFINFSWKVRTCVLFQRFLKNFDSMQIWFDAQRLFRINLINF